MTMLGVLITQCLQNDFVKPLPPFTPLPKLLHVGHDEARRLMGDDPGLDPLSTACEHSRSSKEIGHPTADEPSQ